MDVLFTGRKRTEPKQISITANQLQEQLDGERRPSRGKSVGHVRCLCAFL